MNYPYFEAHLAECQFLEAKLDLGNGRRRLNYWPFKGNFHWQSGGVFVSDESQVKGDVSPNGRNLIHISAEN